MPFKSQAQRRKFAQLLVEGKISDQTFEEWNRETGAKKLVQALATPAERKRLCSPHQTSGILPVISASRHMPSTWSTSDQNPADHSRISR